MNIATPVITSLKPNHIPAGSGDLTCIVTGRNFSPDSMVQWNGQKRDTKFISQTQLEARLSASDFQTARLQSVSIATPPELISNRFFFAVTARKTLVIVSAATMAAGSITIESIASATGTNLAEFTQEAPPCRTASELAERRVAILPDVGDPFDAGLFLVSKRQVRFQIPEEIAAGGAQVNVVKSSGEIVDSGTMRVTLLAAPGLFSIDRSGRGLADGKVVRTIDGVTHAPEPIARFNPRTGKFDPVPINLGDPKLDKAIMTLTGTGIRHHIGLRTVGARIKGLDTPVIAAERRTDCSTEDIVALEIAGELKDKLIGAGESDIEVIIGGTRANVVKALFS